jgi:hypothetical protein
MSTQGVMSNKEANNNPGMCPVKGQQSGLYSQMKAQNQFLSQSQGTDKTCLSELPVKEPSLQVPLTELP